MRKTSLHLLFLCAILVTTFRLSACKGKEQPGAGAPGAPGQPAAAAVPAGPPPDVTEGIDLGNQLVDTVHSKFDQGRIQDLFDGSKDTLARTENATTALVELSFPAPKVMRGVDVTTGSMDVGLKATLTLAGKTEPAVFSKTFAQLPLDPTVSLDFGGPKEVKKIRLEISNVNGGDGHIHIRELRFK